MLILKENFSKLKLLGFVLWVLFACGAAAPCAGAATGSTAPPPDAVAAAFYDWYLDALSADQDPLSDRHERFTRYVARALVAHLVARMAVDMGAAPAADYFLKTPHYHSAWLRTRVRALTVARQARRAEVIVTLGEGSDARQLLGLAMVLEDGAWKIRDVERAARDAPDTGAAESSTGPPGI